MRQPAGERVRGQNAFKDKQHCKLQSERLISYLLHDRWKAKFEERLGMIGNLFSMELDKKEDIYHSMLAEA